MNVDASILVKKVTNQRNANADEAAAFAALADMLQSENAALKAEVADLKAQVFALGPKE